MLKSELKIDIEKINNILWQCRRGMLELDKVLFNFVNNYYNNISIEQQQAFELLLQENDADLFVWIFGENLPDNTVLKNLILMIKKKF